MKKILRLWVALLSLHVLNGAAAVDADTLKRLASDDSDEKIAAISQLVIADDPLAIKVLQALGDDALNLANGRVIIVDGEQAFDAATGAEIKPVPEDMESISINNRVRAKLERAMGILDLRSTDREQRLKAADALQDGVGPDFLPLLNQAIAREQDGEIKQLLLMAKALASIKSENVHDRLEAVKTLANSDSPKARIALQALVEKNGDATGDTYGEPDPGVRHEAEAALRSINSRLAFAENIGRVFSGISLGSILMLAALGLAIIYGVMGVINMAHGELLMVGAYATYMVQNFFHAHMPQLQDWYVVAAVPVSFFAAAIVGIILERTVIRFLYGRPLETLLATWGISLILIQIARVIFGAQNVEVANPSWMSGGIELMANVVLPWNRIVIIGFSVSVLALMWGLLNLTRLGLFVRAVTQNRSMAGCMGVPTGRVDSLAFGLGAGIAGLGGCALSQVANVGPDMGQGYIVDSFMVVVLGGVGQLAGAAWAALGLGIISKFLEGWVGAVIAKIIVLAFIIVFIQKRPQGLFALKGRTVEA